MWSLTSLKYNLRWFWTTCSSNRIKWNNNQWPVRLYCPWTCKSHGVKVPAPGSLIFALFCTLAFKAIYRKTETVIHITEMTDFVTLHMFKGLRLIHTTLKGTNIVFHLTTVQTFTEELKARLLTLKFSFSWQVFWTGSKNPQSSCPRKIFPLLCWIFI